MISIIREKGLPPKYIQLSSWLKNMIEKGRYGIGEKLPSENELASMFNVNRNTVRQAILQLVNEGLVIKKNGVGTFVISKNNEKLQYPLTNITSLTNEFIKRGIKPRTRLIVKKVIYADEEMAKKLMLGSDNRVIEIKRVRCGNGIPLVIERSYLSYRDFKGLLEMDIPDSLYKVLIEKFNVSLEHSVQALWAIELGKEDAKLLKVRPGFPAIFQESIIYDKENIAIELLHSCYRGDKFIFKVESGRFSPTNIT